MHYIPKTTRLQLGSSLEKLAVYVNDAEHSEETLSVVIAQILNHYICCGYQCSPLKSPALPPECDPLVEETIAALNQFDTDALE